MKSRLRDLLIPEALLLLLLATRSFPQVETPAEQPPGADEKREEEKQVQPSPDRRPGEGEGPFEKLIIRGATLIDGTGAPPIGPVDIVIEGNRITRVKSVGVPKVAIKDEGRPRGATRELDAHGSYVLPGFINLHAHTGGVPKAPEAEYPYKLWMAHGITTIRGVPCGPLEWTLRERERSAANEIVAPRIIAYHRLGTGEEWKDRQVLTADDAREWVLYAKKKGIDGLKLNSHRPEIMKAALEEAGRLGLGSTAHLAQTGIAQMNALDAARLGLRNLTHFYGLFEALYRDHDVQPWPPDMNYNDEQHRFGQVARQWNLVHPQGTGEWNALIREFLAPIANLKVLYGTGAVRLSDETGKPERVGGVRYTIKDGIIYDAKRLLEDVERW